MNLVNDLAHFSALVKAAKRQTQRVESNCYLLPDVIQRYTQQKRLYWQEFQPAGLIFFSDERDFFRMYYFIGEPDEHSQLEPFPRQARLIKLDLDYRAMEAASRNQAYWLKQGFSLQQIHKRMELTRPFDSINLHQQFPAFPGEYSLEQLTDRYLDQIQTLWKDSLGISSSALSDQTEILEMIENKQLFGMLYKNEKRLAGVLRCRQTGKVYTLERIAVDALHRQRGLARTLILYCLFQAVDAGRFLLWVGDENSAAVKLYQSLGFQFDGRVSLKLFLEKY
jgi:GNAT superfamily N-acetyltransferase